MGAWTEYSALTAGDSKQRCTLRYLCGRARSKMSRPCGRMHWNRKEGERSWVTACNEQLFVSLVLLTRERFSSVWLSWLSSLQYLLKLTLVESALLHWKLSYLIKCHLNNRMVAYTTQHVLLAADIRRQLFLT